MGAPPMEGFRVSINLKNILASLTATLLLASCSSIMKYEKSEQLKNINEFDKTVKIEQSPEEGAVPAVEAAPAVTPKTVAKKPVKKAPVVKAKVKSKAVVPAAPLVRQPDLEDTEGFAVGSRRPLVDPFRVGEVVTHSVSYFKLHAGELKLKVEKFAQVNGRKAYTFATEIKSASLFSSIYTAEDRVETLVDFDLLVPRVFALHVKESGQLKEARSFFDLDKNHATYWEKKVTKKDGEEEKKQEWEILPFSQNVFSAAFYMRIFKWDVGKEYAFRVADDEQNLVFKGTAIRKEVLDTDLGPMKAIVIKPQVMLKGAFKPMGDIFIWLSDDEHKYILRIESKIKIGTLVSEVTKIE